MTQTLKPPAIRPKSFTYRTSAEWLGRRNVRFSAPTKESLVVSNPPEFRGEEGFWTPEELFIGAVETCLLVTFAGLVEKHNLPVEGYSSEAIGVLETREGDYQFTKVTVKPTIIVTDKNAAPRILEMVERAHRDCLIGNSQRAEIVVEPTVLMSASE